MMVMTMVVARRVRRGHCAGEYEYGNSTKQKLLHRSFSWVDDLENPARNTQRWKVCLQPTQKLDRITIVLSTIRAFPESRKVHQHILTLHLHRKYIHPSPLRRLRHSCFHVERPRVPRTNHRLAL